MSICYLSFLHIIDYLHASQSRTYTHHLPNEIQNSLQQVPIATRLITRPPAGFPHTSGTQFIILRSNLTVCVEKDQAPSRQSPRCRLRKILKHEAYVRLILRKLGGQYKVREGVLIRVWKSFRGDILSLMRSNRLVGMWANVGNA